MGVCCNILTIFLFIYRTKAIVNDRYYPRYHLAPPSGWMNDPNGFSYYRGEYHMFYQHNPYSSSVPGTAHWGHAKSKDLMHWQHLPIAMYPDKPYDRNGVFSGSALIEDDTMYLYYTGRINHSGKTPDHEEHQALGISTDGINVVKFKSNPIINNFNRQPDIRDPKVWKHGDMYYIVLGNSFNNSTLGRVLLYSSKDKINWQEVSVLGQSDGFLGYMWECPDFFQLGDHYILLFSPQGVKPDGDKYRNLYQTGYIVGDFDYETLIFKHITGFQELDHGHDFYATQTLLDKKGRRIVVGWFDMWKQEYPESGDGFHGLITIPRTLSLNDELRVIQKPVNEIKLVKRNVIYSGRGFCGTNVQLDNKAGEVFIKTTPEDLEVYIESENVSVTILYDAQNGLISLDRGGKDGIRRTEWKPTVIILHIYIDASSIEVFCGNGEVTFSSRYFPNGPVNVRLGYASYADRFRVTNMKRVVYAN